MRTWQSRISSQEVVFNGQMQGEVGTSVGFQGTRSNKTKRISLGLPLNSELGEGVGTILCYMPVTKNKMLKSNPDWHE